VTEFVETAATSPATEPVKGGAALVAPPAAGRWFVVGMLLLMYVAAYIDRALIALMVDPIKATLSLSEVQFSLIHGAAFGLFYALFGIPMGFLADKLSKRWLLFTGITIWSVAASACGLARNFASLALARFGVGAGEATLVPIAYATISGTFPKSKVASAIAIFSTGSMIGTALALSLGGFMLAFATRLGGATLPVVGHLEPWQLVLLLSGAPGLVLSLFSFLLPEVRGEASKRASSSAGEFWRYLATHKAYLFLSIGGLSCTAIMAYGAAAWTPAFLMRRYGMPVESVGAGLGFMTLCGIGGLLSAGAIADALYKSGRRDAHFLTPFAVTPLVPVVGAYAYTLASGPMIAITLLALVHLLQIMPNTVASHLQITTAPALRGRVAALTVSVQHMAGLTLGPTLVAAITQGIFHDPSKVGLSLAIVTVVLGSLATLMYGLARGPARLAAQQAEDGAPRPG